MAQTSPGSRVAQARSHSRVRSLARQLGWASVPIWSVTLLAPAPFLMRAISRRRAADWAVFAAYLGIVVLELVLLTVGKAGSATATVGALLLLLLLLVAPVHAFVAFRPGAGPWSWRDMHAVSGAGEPASEQENVASADAMHDRHDEEAAAGRDVRADAKRAVKAERKAFRAAVAKARQERLDRKAPQRAERAAQKAERAAQKAASRAAAQAARLAAPRYGWVETRRTYRRKTIFGNRRSETVVSLPSERNARRRTRQRGGVTITEEWRRLD